MIHLTGTNGKTSTARMTETLLRARGLRTGLFTSPHLSAISERICVDGEPLTAERFVGVYEEIAPYLDLVDASQPAALSFFEVLVGMAFAVFADAPVDVAVIEVGMGGTWDNTNVADGAVAVVTPIAIDHARYLGNTVEAIAADKAGIIKPGAVAVLAQQPLDAAEVLLRRAAEVGATVAREGLEFGVTSRELAVGGQLLSVQGLLGHYQELFLPLFGAYQASNAACALAAVEAFAGAAGGDPADAQPLDEDLVREAFAQMSSPGRLEIVRRSPTVIVDAAHNPAGMAASLDALTEAFSFTDLVGILAVSEDKDVPAILDQLEPVVTELVVTANSSSRSMDPAKLRSWPARCSGPTGCGRGPARRRDRDRRRAGRRGGDRLRGRPGQHRGPDHRLGDHRGRRAGAARGRPGQPGGRRAVRRLCATVLIMEAIVIGLAIPVALTVEHASRRPAALAGGVLVAAAVLLAVLAARGPLRLVLAGGSLLQVLVLAAGAVVPAMYFLGAVFALLWGTGIWLGRRFESTSSAR